MNMTRLIMITDLLTARPHPSERSGTTLKWSNVCRERVFIGPDVQATDRLSDVSGVLQ